nr:kunitz type trypsin inhibitor 111-like [Ziziphus jujuba var. spinosa]
MKLIIGSLSLIWLVIAVAMTVHIMAVLDTSGQPLESGVEYYINPAISDNGHHFSLVDRNNSCPFYAGQDNVSRPKGYPVTLAPFEEGENVVRETKNFNVTFSAFTICVQSTAWKVGEQDPETKRRLIITGVVGSYSNYFFISKEQVGGNVYRIVWCPAELCPTCRFACGNVGALAENGKKLLALDGSALSVVFEKA